MAGMFVLTVILANAHASLALPILAVATVFVSLPPRCGTALKLLLSPVVVFTAVTGTAGVAQLIGHGLQPLLVYGPIICISALLWRPRATTDNSTGGWDQIVPLACAALAMAFLVTPAANRQSPLLHGVTQRISMSATAEDGATHYSLVDAMRTLGGYAYGDSGKRLTIGNVYPSAFHINVAALDRTLDDTAGAPQRVSRLYDVYRVSGIGVFALLILSLSSVAPVLRSQGLHISRIASASTSISIACFTFFWYPFSVFTHNFFPQLTSLWLLSVLVVTVLALGSRKHLTYAVRLFFLGVTTIAIGGAWPFVLPIAFAALAMWTTLNWDEVRRRYVTTIAIGTATLVGSCLPVGIFTQLSINASVFNAVGGVDNVPFGAITGIALLAVAAIVAFRESIDRSTFRLALVTLAVSTGFTLALGAYQIATAHTLNYFYYKSAYTVLVIGAMICSIGLAFAMSLLHEHAGGWAAYVCAASLVLLTGITDVTHGRAWDYRQGRTVWADYASLSSFVYRWHEVNHDIVIVWTGDMPNDYISSRWTSALAGHDDNDLVTFLQRVVLMNQDVRLLQRFADTRSERVVVQTRDITSMRRGLAQASRVGIHHQVEVVPD